MQKKIIAIAVAAALAAPVAAMADASVYGQVNLSYDRVTDGANGKGTANEMNSNTSRLGVKASEDLGNGMSVVAQAEGTLAADNGGMGGKATAGSVNQIFDRNTYLGLSSNDMGTLILGQYDTPYKISTRKLDLFADGIADNRGSAALGTSKMLMGMGHDTTLSNMLAYVSPAFNGVTIAAATVFGAEAYNSTMADKGSATSLAAMYTMDNIYATVAYQTVKAGSAGTGDLAAGAFGTVASGDKNTAMKVGVGFSQDQITVNAIVEQTKLALVAGDTKHTNIYLGGKFAVSSTDAAKLAYTKIGDSSGNKDGGTQISLGYDHSMSKMTTVYALYTKVSPSASGATSPNAISVGVRHSF